MAVGNPASKGNFEDANERLLIDAARENPERFVELYELNFARVYAYIARRVHNRDEAEDLTSEVFHKAFANLQSFEWRGAPFAAWLFRIASNLIVDRAKRAAREHGESQIENSTEVNFEEIEERSRLFRLVNQLPDDQRRVIAMRFAEGKHIREIAVELNRTEGAIKQLQFRGLENLRAKLSRLESVSGE